MEITLGKRIAAGRKEKGLTQDQLAEKLGVTAQAVSKWENDQSCPDINILPKLAEIFGTSTDALLGMEKETVHEAEVVEPQIENEPEGLHFDNGQVEFHYDGGRRSALGMALWVLLTGALMLLEFFQNGTLDMWNTAWPTGLLVFGIMGLYRKFSFLRLGFALIGGYFLLTLNFVSLPYNNTLLLPVLLVLFGGSLLFDALKKPSKRVFSITHKGRNGDFHCNGNRFDCSTTFGEDRRRVQLARMEGGEANVSFGELEVDLSGCQEFAPGCQVELNCSFGELKLKVPKTCRVRRTDSASFGSVEIKGEPNPDAPYELPVLCNVSFGEIEIRYV